MESNPMNFYEQIDDYLEPLDQPGEEVEKRRSTLRRKPTLPPRNKTEMQAKITKVRNGTDV